MVSLFPFYLSLIVAIVLLIMLAQRFKIAYPVVLVTAGLALSFIPHLPRLHIEPDVIFLIFLPPLLYEAAWNISWKELWRWRRIISSFAFVVVFLTALSVAVVANQVIPGFSLALGFLLGGIVSPPDAVSAASILKFVSVPRRVRSILEGESLLNDASSLLIFRFALIAVSTGQFVWYHAAGSFAWMVAGGVGIGLGIGWLAMKLHRRLPTDVNTDLVLTIVTPYVIYLAAESVHSSGVLAVVSAGLLLSEQRHRFLESASRLRGVNVWESLVFVLNGLVFMLIGLDLPEIIAGLDGISIRDAVGYGLLITGVLVLGRILAAYGAVVVTLVARRFINVADPRNPGLKGPLLLGWTGMRGVVSLAAALAIPATLGNGAPFPQRSLIQFITFVVILVTLTVQGLTLPALIRRLKLTDPDATHSEAEVDGYLRKALAETALGCLRDRYPAELRQDATLQLLAQKWERGQESPESPMTDTCKEVYRDILERQRQWLLEANDRKQLLDEAIVRKHLQYLDLEEERLQYL